LIQKIAHKLIHLGGSLDPHACFLLHRGLKTLAVRMKHQNESALAIAKFLSAHPAVETVNYPGLDTCAGYHLAQKLLDGFSGMLSFEINGDVSTADEFIARTHFPISAPSLGGVETLITRPATTSHSGLSPAERKAAGISDRLIRLSVGLETTEDLIDDFDQALT
jgi:cystathionine beta-lyase/cystathionine gamma-synthase